MSPTDLLEQLKWSLQVLALPADLQIQQFPAFAVVTDELMLEFDNWSKAAAGSRAYSAQQQEALHQLNSIFDQICGPDAAVCAKFASSAALAGSPPRST